MPCHLATALGYLDLSAQFKNEKTLRHTSCVTAWMSPLYAMLALNLETASAKLQAGGGVTKNLRCDDSISSSTETWRGTSRFPRSIALLRTCTSLFPEPTDIGPQLGLVNAFNGRLPHAQIPPPSSNSLQSIRKWTLNSFLANIVDIKSIIWKIQQQATKVH